MSVIYKCVDCDMRYCASCDGGEDSCPRCSTGPRCDDCAADHLQEHKEQDEEAQDA